MIWRAWLCVVTAAVAWTATTALAVAETEGAPPDAAAGHVARSIFTTGVVDREPTDSISRLGNDSRRIVYFTEIRGMKGKTVIHRWKYGDQVKGEVAFDVGADRWRVHSSKQLDPSWLGVWTVIVVDVDGNTLSEETFTYVAAEADPAQLAPPAASE
jgi:hypothetical protein